MSRDVNEPILDVSRDVIEPILDERVTYIYSYCGRIKSITHLGTQNDFSNTDRDSIVVRICLAELPILDQ